MSSESSELLEVACPANRIPCFPSGRVVLQPASSQQRSPARSGTEASISPLGDTSVWDIKTNGQVVCLLAVGRVYTVYKTLSHAWPVAGWYQHEGGNGIWMTPPHIPQVFAQTSNGWSPFQPPCEPYNLSTPQHSSSSLSCPIFSHFLFSCAAAMRMPPEDIQLWGSSWPRASGVWLKTHHCFTAETKPSTGGLQPMTKRVRETAGLLMSGFGLSQTWSNQELHPWPLDWHSGPVVLPSFLWQPPYFPLPRHFL